MIVSNEFLRGLLRRLFNAMLRSLSLLSKFFLLFFLAKYFDFEELGEYGLITSSVSYSMTLVGVELYNYSQREMIKLGHSLVWSFLRQQIIFHVWTYFVVLPCLWAVFWLDLIDVKYALLFFLLVIAEHLSQEVSRVFIAFGQQIKASMLLLVRSSVWVLFVVPAFYFVPELRTVQVVLLIWVSGSIVSVVFGYFLLIRAFPRSNGKKLNVDWWQGLKVSLLYLLSALAIKGFFTLDRYMFEILDPSNKTVLGVYVFYSALVVAGVNFLYPSIFAFVYPKLIRSYRAGDKTGFIRCSWELVGLTVIGAAVILSAIWIAAPFMAAVLEKQELVKYLAILAILIWAAFVYALNMIPHYLLYAAGYDKPVVLSYVVGFAVTLLLFYLLRIKLGYIAVPVALVGGLSLALVVKLFAYVVLYKELYSRFNKSDCNA